MTKRTHYKRIMAMLIALIISVSAFAACGNIIEGTSSLDNSSTENMSSLDESSEASSEASSESSSEVESSVPEESDDTSVPNESQDESSMIEVSNPEFIDVTRIEFESTTIKVDLNTITPIVVNVYPEDATNGDYTLSSSDEAILKVMLTNVMGLTNGEVTLTATSASNPEVSATCRVVIGEGAEKPHTCSFNASKTVEATCTDKGYTTYKCSCGVTENRDYVAALGHNESAWKVEIEATTTTNGLKRKGCTRCGAILDEEIIPMVTNTEDPDAKYNVPATADNAKLVEERILYYLNLYRVQDGVQEATALLNGKTYKYAKMRAEQLVDNFAHDTQDIRSINNMLEFGEYHPEAPEYYYDWETDTLIETGNMTPAYYAGGCSEAICGPLVGYNWTVDHVAKVFAQNIYDSKAHWSYVGAETTKHITTGVCNPYGYTWYACFATSSSDEYD